MIMSCKDNKTKQSCDSGLFCSWNSDENKCETSLLPFFILLGVGAVVAMTLTSSSCKRTINISNENCSKAGVTISKGGVVIGNGLPIFVGTGQTKSVDVLEDGVYDWVAQGTGCSYSGILVIDGCGDYNISF